MRQRRPLGTLLALIALVVPACASTTEEATTAADSTETSQATDDTTTDNEAASVGDNGDSSPQLYDAAKAKALEITGGEEIGGKVTLLGVLGGDERDQYLSAYAPFEEATGIDIQYEGTRDLQAVLQTRVDGGNPPDSVFTPALGQLQAMAAEGDVVPLDEVLDMDTVTEEFDAGLLELGTVDGSLYGIVGTAAVKGLIYYNVDVYDGPTAPESWEELAAWAEAKAAEGTTPWCIGLEAGAASGWPATDWIEQLFINQSGTDDWDAWWRGEVSWTSPKIKEAFEAFGAIATDDAMVNGGATAVVSTNFLDAANPLFADPPGCLLHNQADWMGGYLATAVDGVVQGENLDVFDFPNDGSVEIAGGMLAILVDNPQTRAFIEYGASAEHQAILAGTGLWLAPNKTVDLSVYTTPLGARAAETLVSASSLHFDASDLMPAAVNEAFWRATLDYVSGAKPLDEVLADLEEVRLAQQGGS